MIGSDSARFLDASAATAIAEEWARATDVYATVVAGDCMSPLVKRGAYINAGMRIGYVTDYVGKVLFDARAKESGVLLYVRAVPSINKGDTIASVGVVGKAP